MSATCRSCGAAIAWAVTEHGNAIPLDVTERADGNIVVRIEGGARVAVYDLGGTNVPRYVSHFVTCPNAAEHRRTR